MLRLGIVYHASRRDRSTSRVSSASTQNHRGITNCVVRPLLHNFRQRLKAVGVAQKPGRSRAIFHAGRHHRRDGAGPAGVTLASHFRNNRFRPHARYKLQNPSIIFHGPGQCGYPHAGRRKLIRRPVMRQVAAGEIDGPQPGGRYGSREPGARISMARSLGGVWIASTLAMGQAS